MSYGYDYDYERQKRANNEKADEIIKPIKEKIKELIKQETQDLISRIQVLENKLASLELQNGSPSVGGKNSKKQYKTTKTKALVNIKNKSCSKTVYVNAKKVKYIRVNNEYVLLSKFKK